MSSNYRIFETNEYLKCLKKFSKHDHEYILKKTKSKPEPDEKTDKTKNEEPVHENSDPDSDKPTDKESDKDK